MIRRIGVLIFGVLGLTSLVLWTASSAQAKGGKVETGSYVKIVYSLDADGEPVVPDNNKEEMELIAGNGTFPPAFEKHLIGMKKGDKKVVTLKPEDAYGPYRQESVKRIPNEQLPAGLQLEEGSLIGGKSSRPMRVVKVLEDSVVLDQNHPLAGKTLVYRVVVKEIKQ